MATSKFVIANNLKLHLLDHGADGKFPLVCLHGLTGNAHNFDGLAPHLTGAHHVRALDVRGRGDSAWGPSDQYDAPHYVADLRAIADVLGIKRCSLIGTSMGGVISILFASLHPDRIDRIVLNDIGPEIDPAGIRRISGYVGNSPKEFNDLTEVAAYYRENYPPMASMGEAALIEAVKWSVKPIAAGKLGWKMDPAVRGPMRSISAAQPSPAVLPAPNMWTQYEAITAPILIVRGADSDILSRATTKRMCETVRGTRAIEIPGVGHAPSLLEPESLSAIKEFLAR
jgi:pimeloyl-ACP methyl ester carboxylesterase